VASLGEFGSGVDRVLGVTSGISVVWVGLILTGPVDLGNLLREMWSKSLAQATIKARSPNASRQEDKANGICNHILCLFANITEGHMSRLVSREHHIEGEMRGAFRVQLPCVAQKHVAIMLRVVRDTGLEMTDRTQGARECCYSANIGISSLYRDDSVYRRSFKDKFVTIRAMGDHKR